MKQIFISFVQLSVFGSVPALGFLLFRTASPRLNWKIKRVLWIIVFTRFLIPFYVPITISGNISTQAWNNIVTEIGRYIQTETSYEQVVQISGWNLTSTSVIPMLWISIFLILIIKMLLGYIKLFQKLRTAVLIKDNIYQSEYALNPFTFGVFFPKIYVSENLSGDYLENVILHENNHIAAGDHLLKPLMTLIVYLHWFNPFMWFFLNEFSKDLEYDCDTRTFNKLSENAKIKYLNSLIVLGSEKGRINDISFGGKSIRKRVARLVETRNFHPVLIVITVVIFMSSFVLGCTRTYSYAFKYPERSEMSVEEYRKACHIDTKVLSAMSENELITAVETYPFLSDFFLCSSDISEDKVQFFINSGCGALAELITREEWKSKVKERVKSMKVGIPSVGDEMILNMWKVVLEGVN